MHVLVEQAFHSVCVTGSYLSLTLKCQAWNLYSVSSSPRGVGKYIAMLIYVHRLALLGRAPTLEAHTYMPTYLQTWGVAYVD